jgi:hypothetical protein
VKRRSEFSREVALATIPIFQREERMLEKVEGARMGIPTFQFEERKLEMLGDGLYGYPIFRF